MRKPQAYRRRRDNNAFTLEALEPHVLFSADAALVWSGPATDLINTEQSLPAWQATIASANDASAAAVEAQEASIELVITDRAVDDADWIADQLRSAQRPDRVIVFLEVDDDGIDQISESHRQ